MKNELKEKLLHVTKKCYEKKLLTGISGNVSCFDRTSGIIAITPSSLPYDEMEAADIVCIDIEGNILSGPGRPSSEWPMHTLVYKERPDISAQIHTHSTYATAFAVNNLGIPVVLIEMVPVLGGDVLVAEFALPGSAQVGQNALKVLKERSVCLLANHGVLAVGESLEQAYLRAACVEEVSKVYSIALNNGSVNILSDEIVSLMKGK